MHKPAPEISLENEKKENSLLIYFKTIAQDTGFGLLKKHIGVDGYLLYTCTEFVYTSAVIPCFNAVNIRVPYEVVFILPKEWDVVFSGHDKENVNLEDENRPKWITGELENWIDKEVGEDLEVTEIYHFKVLQQEASPYSLFFCIGNIIEIGDNVWATTEKFTSVVKIINELKDCALEWIKTNLKIPINSKRMKTIILPDLKNRVRDYYSVILLSEKEIKDAFDTRSTLVQSIANRICHQLFGHCVTPASLNDICINEGICTYLASIVHESYRKKLSFETMSPSLMKVQIRNQCLAIDDLAITPTVGQLDQHKLQVAEPNDSFVAHKSAFALTQLESALGRSEFLDFLRELVHMYKWADCSKAQFHDLLVVRSGLMENGSRKDSVLRWWDDWLESPGANLLAFEVRENDILVRQTLTPVSGNRHRMHFVSLMFLDSKGSSLGTKSFAIKAAAQCRLSHSLVAQSAAIVPNCDGATYARVHLDIETFKFLRDNLNCLQYKMTRLMVFQSYFDCVRATAMDPIHFCKVVIKHYDQKLSRAYQDRIVSEYFWPVMSLYLKTDQFQAVAHTFFLLCFKLLQKSQLYGCMPSFMVRCCKNKADVLKMVELVDAMPASAPGKKEFASLMVLKAQDSSEIDDDSKQRVYDQYADIYERTSPELVVGLNNMLEFIELTPADKRGTLYDKLISKAEKSYADCLEALKTIPEYLEEEDLSEYLEYISSKFLDHLPVLSKYLGSLLIPTCNCTLKQVVSRLEALKDTEKYKMLQRKWRTVFELILGDLKLRARWLQTDDSDTDK